MKKKTKVIIAVSVVSAYAVAFAFIFGMFWMMCHTSKSVRKEMYNHYSDDSTYVTIYGDAYFKLDYANNLSVIITLSEECVQSLNAEQGNNYTTDKSYSYIFHKANRKALEDNGFYGAMTEVIEDGSTTYYRVNKPVTLIINESKWADRGHNIAVSVTVDETCYLDYETGKANLLYYVQNIMK